MTASLLAYFSCVVELWYVRRRIALPCSNVVQLIAVLCEEQAGMLKRACEANFPVVQCCHFHTELSVRSRTQRRETTCWHQFTSSDQLMLFAGTMRSRTQRQGTTCRHQFTDSDQPMLFAATKLGPGWSVRKSSWFFPGSSEWPPNTVICLRSFATATGNWLEKKTQRTINN
jgi:hypothetical protein